MHWSVEARLLLIACYQPFCEKKNKMIVRNFQACFLFYNVKGSFLLRVGPSGVRGIAPDGLMLITKQILKRFDGNAR